MKHSRVSIWLAMLVVILAAACAAVGLWYDDGGAPFSFTTLHGEIVQIDGSGLYRYDTAFKAPILRGTDVVTLFLCVPLLTASIFFYRHGSLRGGLMMTALLAYFLYNAASLAFGVAYNVLHLAYIAYFSASLFAFILAVSSIERERLADRFSATVPRRGISVFLVLAGTSTLVWLLDIVGALASGTVPQGLASYTTEITYVIDIGVIAPAALVASVQLRRGASIGYLLAAILLVVNAIIGIVVIAQTVMQSMAGIALTTGQLVAFVGTFVAMSVAATWLAVLLFRGITPESSPPARP